MNRTLLLLISMVFTAPVHAQNVDIPENWTGYYIGAQAGLLTETEFSVDGTPGSTETEGESGTVFFGARRQHGDFVFGGELDFLWSDQTVPGFEDEGSIRVTATRLGGQVGYNAGRLLPYATLGIARMTFQDTIAFDDISSFGVFAGLGFDYQLGEATMVGVEAVRQSFTDFDASNPVNYEFTSVGVNFGIRF